MKLTIFGSSIIIAGTMIFSTGVETDASVMLGDTLISFILIGFIVMMVGFVMGLCSLFVKEKKKSSEKPTEPRGKSKAEIKAERAAEKAARKAEAAERAAKEAVERLKATERAAQEEEAEEQ